MSPLRLRRPAGYNEWLKLAIGIEFYVGIVLASLASPWWWLTVAVSFVGSLVLHLRGARDVLQYIRRPIDRRPECDCSACMPDLPVIDTPAACPRRGMYCDCPECQAIIPQTGTTFVTQRRLDIAADDAGVQLGHTAEPSAARGQFWSTIAAGAFSPGRQLAVDREAQERADYQLVVKKLAGINRPQDKP